MNIRRMMSIVKKEIIQIRRDPPSLVMAFIVPVMMLMIFGYAVTTDVDHIKSGCPGYVQEPAEQADDHCFQKHRIF